MIRVRIVNKAKDGVILKTGNLQQKISWEDFNSAWTIDPKDKLYAIMNKDKEDEAAKVNDLVQEAVIALMTGRGENPHAQLISSMMLGSLVDKFQKLVPDGTPADFLYIVREAYQKQTNAFLNAGVGFTHKDDNEHFNSRQRRQNKHNLERIAKEKVDEDKFTIGDAIKIQEQRDKIRKHLTNYYVCSSKGKVLEN